MRALDNGVKAVAIALRYDQIHRHRLNDFQAKTGLNTDKVCLTLQL